MTNATAIAIGALAALITAIILGGTVMLWDWRHPLDDDVKIDNGCFPYDWEKEGAV